MNNIYGNAQIQNTRSHVQPRIKATRGAASPGFTLIEILVVIALTVILFGILLRPLIQALNYSRDAQAQTAAQDSGRKVVEMLRRELGSATYVMDNDSHAFNATTPAANADLSTNFLDLEVPTSTNTRVIGHCYNALIDYVDARHVTGEAVDPTTNEPINLGKSVDGGSAVLNGTNVETSIAPGTTVVRWFVGLKDPTKPYSNTNENLTSNNGQSNTYVLYRAQFSLTVPRTAQNPTGQNSNLFEISGAGKLEVNDPDFFRYVNAGTDVNWLSVDHHAYTSAEALDHNTRVDNWQKIAKPVITAPEIDLLVLPRDSDGNIDFDQSGPYLNIAHFGTVSDPVAGAATNPTTGDNTWPVVRSSVTFEPSGEPEQAVPATTSQYQSAGIPGAASDTGSVYVPSVYVANRKSWSAPYGVKLISGANILFTTGINSVPFTQPTYTVDTGDLMEYDRNQKAVFDVTKQMPVYSSAGVYVSNYFVPMALDPDRGTINFAFRAIPPPTVNPNNPTVNPNNVFWNYDPATVDSSTDGGTVDLKNYSYNGANYSPLGEVPGSSSYPGTGLQIENAHIVPGSVRVVAPDSTPGPDFGQPTEYDQIAGLDSPGPNQFKVDYTGGFVQFHQVLSNGSAASDIPQFYADNSTPTPPIKISYDYQSNMVPVPAPGSGFAPMVVDVNYKSRDIIDAQIGVRVYAPGKNRAQIIPNEAKIKVGDSNR